MVINQKDFFNNLANTWDIPVENIAIAQEMIERLGIQSGERVLDVGCGTGILYELLRHRTGVEYVGMDISDKMLEQFKGRFPEANLVQGDFENEWHQWGEEFDYCIIFNSIPHFNDMIMTIMHAASYLKEGGKLAIVHCRTREGLKAHHRAIGYQSQKEEPIPLNEELVALCRDEAFGDIMIEESHYFYFEATKREIYRSIEEEPVEVIADAPCPCCGYITIPNQGDALAYICPVCFWEIDLFIQSETEPSDQNHGLTLIQARENYKQYGAVEKHLVQHARAPKDEARFLRLTSTDKLWEQVILYAEQCSWRAGQSLAQMMREQQFTDWEGVIIALDNNKIAGYCTVTKVDCIPDLTYTPYIGYIFVDECYRGKRLSQKMIQYAMAYLESVGFEYVYLISDHVNLYEKYGFEVIDVKMAPWGSEEKIYRRGIAQ